MVSARCALGRDRDSVQRIDLPSCGATGDALGLGEAKREVEVLHSLGSATLPEVVDGRKDEDAGPIVIEHGMDATDVRPLHVTRLGQLGNNFNEQLFPVSVVVQREQLVGLDAIRRGHIAADELALVDRNEVGNKADLAGIAQLRQLLFDLRIMLVFRYAVRLHAVEIPHEPRSAFPSLASAGYPGLRVYHEVPYEALASQRGQRQNRRRRIAARLSNQLG